MKFRTSFEPSGLLQVLTCDLGIKIKRFMGAIGIK